MTLLLKEAKLALVEILSKGRCDSYQEVRIVYLKVTKFSDTLNLTILYLMKLVHIVLNLAVLLIYQLMQSISHTFERFSVH